MAGLGGKLVSFYFYFSLRQEPSLPLQPTDKEEMGWNMREKRNVSPPFVGKVKRNYLGTMNIYKFSLTFFSCMFWSYLFIIKNIKRTETHNQGQSIHGAWQAQF